MDRCSNFGCRRDVRGAAFVLFILSLQLCAQELPKAIRQRLHQGTVLVNAWYRPIGKPDAKSIGPFQGSGFIIASDGLIVTNAHCVDPVTVVDLKSGKRATDMTPVERRRVLVLAKVDVRLRSGRKDSQVYAASLLCTRPMPVDLALLRIRPKEKLTTLAVVTEEEFGKVEETMTVWAIGFPFGSGPEKILAGETKLERNPLGTDLSFRGGSIRALRRKEKDTVKAIDHSCEIAPGNSGGPLVDDKGRVIGVNYYGGGTFSFAIPAPVLRKEFSRLFHYRFREGAERGMAAAANESIAPVPDDRDKVYRRLVELTKHDAPWGSTITLGAGKFHINDLLVIRASGLHLRGAGKNKTQIVLGPTGRIFCSSGWIEMSDLKIVAQGTGGVEPWKKHVHAKRSSNGFIDREAAAASLAVHAYAYQGTTGYFHDLHIDGQDLPVFRVTTVPDYGSLDVTNVDFTIAREKTTRAVEAIANLPKAKAGHPRFVRCRIQRAKNVPVGNYANEMIKPSYIGCDFFVKGKEFEHPWMLHVYEKTDVTVMGCWFDLPRSDEKRHAVRRTAVGGIKLSRGRLIAMDNLFDLWARSMPLPADFQSDIFQVNSFPDIPAGVSVWPQSTAIIHYNRFQVHRGPSELHDSKWSARIGDLRIDRDTGRPFHVHKKVCYNYALAFVAMPGIGAKEKGYTTTENLDVKGNLFDNAGWQSCFRYFPKVEGNRMPDDVKSAWWKMMNQNKFIRSEVKKNK